MKKAREMVKGGYSNIKDDENKREWPNLCAGDMVKGQDLKTKEWSPKGEVLELVHGERAVNRWPGRPWRQKRTDSWRSQCRKKRKRQRPHLDQGELRRSPWLMKKTVTMGRQGTVDDPEILPHYMEAVERGWAGTKHKARITG